MPRPLPDLVRGTTPTRRLLRAGLPILLLAGAFVVLSTVRTQPDDAPEPPPVGLPGGSHLHALAVDPRNADRILLGTHFGIYVSDDRGETWEVAGVEGKDVLDLATSRDSVWAAGVGALARSDDAGSTWTDVAADGLPSRNVRAVAVAHDEALVFVAVADAGLFLSEDRGATFEPTGADVGADVEALVRWGDGGLVAADRRRGLLLDADGDGRRWRTLLRERVRGVVSTNGGFPLFATTSRGVLRVERAGAHTTVLPIAEGAAAITRSTTNASVVYAAGLDRRMYMSRDAGRTWSPTD